MGVIHVFDLVKILKKHFMRIMALCLTVGLLVCIFTYKTQTYTCTLNYKFNYPEALEGKAPDGSSELNPYELQNPAVIQAAINYVNPTGDLSVEGLRSNMSISTIITSLDQEVSESAAILGEKYEVQPVEYQLNYTYSASLGEDFGPRIFDGIIKAYDNFVISKYYNKEHVPDFMQALSNVEVDYLESADIISERISSIISDLDQMADWNPGFRSVRTGHTFSDLSTLYHNLKAVQHAKYHGNIRAGNLAKDTELTIKNYAAKVTDLEVDHAIFDGIAKNYQAEIKTFYDSYKAAGLYHQADNVQVSADSSNNRDREIFRDYEKDFEQLVNTYDNIVTNYTNNAISASSAKQDVDYYKSVIEAYSNDNVDAETKKRLIAANEVILEEMTTLSAQYSALTNTVIDEYYNNRVSNDIRYLISTDISADKSPLVAALLVMVITGVMAAIAVIIIELMKKTASVARGNEDPTALSEESLNKLDKQHRIAYDQYQKGFSEFYLTYQPMLGEDKNSNNHFEVFLRWENPELGNVSPLMIIDYYCDLRLIKELNRWIFHTVCKDIPRITRHIGKKPVVHVNCLYSEIEDFGLNEILVENIKSNHISPSSLCIELDGDDIVSCLEDIIILQDMGLRIGVDHFEAKDSEKEILQVIRPNYVKISPDVFLPADIATTEAEMTSASDDMAFYFIDLVRKCKQQNIMTCICGIENHEQHMTVLPMNFNFRQGFYYCKPLPLSECLDFVAKNKKYR